MKAYICLITIREGEVPQLRYVESPSPDALPAALAPVLAEWDSVSLIEVFEEDTLVGRFDGRTFTHANA